MQRGTISKRGRSWVLRYWEYQVRDGIKTRVNAHKNLAPIGPAYPNKKSVEPLAWKILEPINTRLQTPESATPITEFIETVYLPMVKQFLRPSTYKDYKNDAYERHFKQRLGSLRLREFRTAHGQRMISAIAKDNPNIGHKTLLRLKSFMSGVFRHAKQEGYLDDNNPMRDVTIPKTIRRQKFQGEIYTVEEILKTLGCFGSSSVEFAVVATAAFTGLRLAELRGLQWRDFDPDKRTLAVHRTMWRTKQNLPKTQASESSVPLLPEFQRMLEYYRHHLEGLREEGHLGKDLKPTDWIFQGERHGTSLNLPNLVRRKIIPQLTRCSVCHQTKSAHPNGHPFELDTTIPKWKGWKAFRRSLASNLYLLNVKPKVLQAILRHSDISVTLGFYVETPEAESREALGRLAGLMTRS